jgi:hypothetical protein
MRVPTMRVWRKSDSQPVVINTAAYDIEQYLKSPPKKKATKQTKEVAKDDQVG